MKLKLLAALILPLALSIFCCRGNADLTTLRGGRTMPQGHTQPGTVETKYECNDSCANCNAVPCTQVNGTCTMSAREFSGRCAPNPQGSLETCKTVNANDYCMKNYSNPCTPENAACTTSFGGCGTKYRCQ